MERFGLLFMVQNVLLAQVCFQIIGDVLLAEELDKAAAGEHGLCLIGQTGNGDLAAGR